MLGCENDKKYVIYADRTNFELLALRIHIIRFAKTLLQFSLDLCGK